MTQPFTVENKSIVICNVNILMQSSVSVRKKLTFVKKYLRINYFMDRSCLNTIYGFACVETRRTKSIHKLFI